MKKLPIVLCLMFLCIALFNSRVYAVTIADIEFFEQSGAGVFTDNFNDGFEPAPLIYTIFADGPFPDGREEFGTDEDGPFSYFELNSDDGLLDEDEIFLSAAVSDQAKFFSEDAGGHVIGTFDFEGVFPSGTFFGIEINSWATDAGGGIAGEADTDDEAWMGLFKTGLGEVHAVWGDENDTSGWLDISSFIVDDLIGMKLLMNGSNSVTALLDYNLDGIYETTLASAFTTLTFAGTTNLFNDIYTGSFNASEEQPIPEPATIALLGIGLVGLAGGVMRRRFRKNKP